MAPVHGRAKPAQQARHQHAGVDIRTALRLIHDAAVRERRVAAGRDEEPLATVITRTGNIPRDIPMFSLPGTRVCVFTASELDTTGWAAEVEVVQVDPSELTLTTVLQRLRAQGDAFEVRIGGAVGSCRRLRPTFGSFLPPRQLLSAALLLLPLALPLLL